MISTQAATLVDVVERLEGVEDDAEVTHGFVFFDLLGVVVVGYSATVARLAKARRPLEHLAARQTPCQDARIASTH